jgi:hypothetical protein
MSYADEFAEKLWPKCGRFTDETTNELHMIHTYIHKMNERLIDNRLV